MIHGQLLRAGRSVGANYRANYWANYRAVCRAKSPADFIPKMGIVEEEADETLFWMELLGEGELLPIDRLTDRSPDRQIA